MPNQKTKELHLFVRMLLRLQYHPEYRLADCALLAEDLNKTTTDQNSLPPLLNKLLYFNPHLSAIILSYENKPDMFYACVACASPMNAAYLIRPIGGIGAARLAFWQSKDSNTQKTHDNLLNCVIKQIDSLPSRIHGICFNRSNACAKNETRF